MERLIHPDKIVELWHISNAKRMWEEFQTANSASSSVIRNPLLIQTITQPYKQKMRQPTWHHGHGWDFPHLNAPIVPKIFLLGYNTRLSFIGRPRHQKSPAISRFFDRV